jgi:hypothetical protein
MIEKAGDPQLKQSFQAHLGETQNHVKRLEQVFRLHGKEATGVDCPAIDGILEEADDVAGEVEGKGVLDAALIAAAQAVLSAVRFHTKNGDKADERQPAVDLGGRVWLGGRPCKGGPTAPAFGG